MSPNPEPCAWCPYPATDVATHKGTDGRVVAMQLCPTCLQTWEALFHPRPELRGPGERGWKAG